MKILHVPFGYFPDACGGTEVYVADLCMALRELGVESVVAAPGAGVSLGEHEGTPVHRYAVSSILTREELHGGGDPLAAEALGAIMDQVQPALVHFHAMTSGVSLLAMKAAKQRRIPVVYTYHTPTATCMRGTLLKWGCEHCDGVMRESICGACYLHHRSVPKMAATGVMALSTMAGALAAKLPAPMNIAWLTKTRIRAAREWLGTADRVVALCEWSRKLLAGNGVTPERLRLVRHGIRDLASRRQALDSSPDTRVIKLVFLGRVDPTKGLDVLLEALRLVPDLPLELHVHAVIQKDSFEQLAKRLRAMAASDPRVLLLEPVPRSEVRRTLEGFDALVVPSIWFETGPLVVLEAFAAGIPVIGSGWGGIAEWVKHEQNGLLVSEPTAQAWANALQRAVLEADLLPRLKAQVQPPRTMTDVAMEMKTVYAELLSA